MNLRNLASIFKRNIKSKKTKYPIPKIDFFFVIAMFLLAITPFVIILVNKISANIRLVNLYVSPRFEELFGREMTESLLSEFNERNPDIRVRLHNNQPDKEPDIIIYDENDIIGGKHFPAAASLASYLGEDKNGVTTVAIPLVSFMDVLYYNIDALSAAGFDRPPRTLGQYQTYSRTVADNGFYCDSLSEPENNRPMSRKLDDFAKGTAAMIIASTRAIPSLREKMGDAVFSLTSIPSDDRTAGRYNINLTGIYAGIGVDSLHKDEAWNFIEFLTEQHAAFCKMFKAIPGTASDVIPGDYVKDDPFYSKAWDIFEYNKTEGLKH